MSLPAAVGDLRARFAAAGDPSRAVQQQRYMKSALPFYGVATPEVRRIAAEVWREHRFGTREEWLAAVEGLWAQPTHREEWYAALALLRHRLYRDWAGDLDNLPTLRRLALAGAWWDVVDELAGHCVGTVLRANPGQAGEILRRWAVEPHLWVRRTAILAQLRRGSETDVDLLSDCLAPSIPDGDFFARKAIGWALRDYAWTNPEWVRRYVDEHPELAALSRREALKHL